MKKHLFLYSTAVLEALKDQGIEGMYVRLLEDVHKECTDRVILPKKSEKFQFSKAVRQGDYLSKILYNLPREVWMGAGRDTRKWRILEPLKSYIRHYLVQRIGRTAARKA